MEETLVSNHRIVVRVTKSQLERIKNNTEATGYSTISAYLRSLALEHDSTTQAKIHEIYQVVVKKAET